MANGIIPFTNKYVFEKAPYIQGVTSPTTDTTKNAFMAFYNTLPDNSCAFCRVGAGSTFWVQIYKASSTYGCAIFETYSTTAYKYVLSNGQLSVKNITWGG